MFLVVEVPVLITTKNSREVNAARFFFARDE
jgi:hypothetical protein